MNLHEISLIPSEQPGPRDVGLPRLRRLPLAALATFLAIWTAGDVPAQVLQQWTHQSLLGESSAAIALDDRYMLVPDNEDETLRLYERYPANSCAAPVSAFNVRPFLNLSSSNPEADLEAAVKVTDVNGTRLYWLGSHSNSKSGNLRPNRYRLFATQCAGDGSGPEPYSLSYVGRYDYLRSDLIAWDQNGAHGKGPNYFGLGASAAAGVASGRVDGFNLEGLVLAPDGTTAYLAFRAPLVNGSGPTTSMEQRTHALLVPLLNMPGLVSGGLPPGPGQCQFGSPITLNLGSRGVRSIDSSYPGQYLITAGPPGDALATGSGEAPYRWFTWTGSSADAPVEQSTEIPAGLNPEGAMVPSVPLQAGTVVQLVSDDSGACWRSFTVALAPKPSSVPQLEISVSGHNVLVSWPLAATGFHLQHTVDLLGAVWVNNPTPPLIYGQAQVVIEPATSSSRFYRLIQQ